jgi:hypothetical protein
MSAPVPERDDGPSTDGASKRVRLVEPEPDSNPVGAPPKVDAAPRSMGRESTEPPWRRSKQRAAFAGDVAIAELRNNLALAPERLPQPPSVSAAPRYTLPRRLTAVGVAAACGLIGFQWGSAPPNLRPQPALPSGQSNQQGFAVPFPPQPTEPAFASPASSKAVVPESDEQKSLKAASRTMSPQLIVGAARPQRADEAARLTVSAKDAGANAAVVIGGLTPGSALSAGTQVGPNTWRLSVEELTNAAITPPLGFVGTMDLTMELHIADNIVVDRKALQMQWWGKSVLAPGDFQPRPHDAAQIASIMKRGAELMATGDIFAARLIYQRLAIEGEAQAVFALAETYDPLVLRQSKNTTAVAPNVALAESWYEMAKSLGSIAAPERLEKLARLPE